MKRPRKYLITFFSVFAATFQNSTNLWCN
jgi:hypothetical protein